MCDGIDGVEQLPVPPLDLRLILSARLSHSSRVSSILSVVGRRCFPQFFVQAAGRSPMSMVDWQSAPEYRILCIYARALTEASTESSIMTFHCDSGMEGSIEMLSIYKSPNTHHPWEDLYAPACVDVVLQGQRDRRVFLYLFPINLFHLCR